jgi:hypothetical protein
MYRTALIVCFNNHGYSEYHFDPINSRTDLRRALSFVMNRMGCTNIHVITDLQPDEKVLLEIESERQLPDIALPLLTVNNVVEFATLLTTFHHVVNDEQFLRCIESVGKIDFFYYSGHIEIRNRERYMVVPGDHLYYLCNNALQPYLAHSINIIDSCHAESFLPNYITSTRYNQKSIFYNPGSIFTHYLFKYLNRAHRRKDYSMKRLQMYIAKKIPEDQDMCTSLSRIPKWFFEGEREYVVEERS